ncbi:signal transduction histidine kinase/DNA-binding response OmpR family regulator/CHASE3 domain sensor protein [Flavobacterium sp. HSC-32F16]|uniref:response regulator n=1 Tax=Flavobacterium sp. HSC-32F16 TaxID=2910964 RepID=UPI0020A5499E|nr:response regulator [Flavobacterium sp. HSC-32F16]MCP2025560.1 signal transduction histidine kinase/DNA-binding response OmpR family regulator/CHASE3 domain sensor protein [Flavobacterium sp. HSC-32F16]
MNGNFKRNLLISSLVSLLVLTISSVASFISIKSLLNSNFWVNHTQDVIYNLNEGSAIITEAQTSMRGYLLTGDEQFVDRFNESEARSNTYFEKLEELTADNPPQQKLLTELRSKRSGFFKYLNNQIVKKRFNKETLIFDLNEGRLMMNDMRALIKKIESKEQNLLEERNANSERYGTYSLILIVVAFFIAFIISIVFLIRILKDYNERSLLQAELEKKDIETAQRIEAISTIAGNISKGNYDIRVDDTKADALGSVGESLNYMGVSLKNSFELLSQKEWLQTGVAELNNAMLGEKSLQKLSKDVIEFLCQYTNSSAGVLYVLEDNELISSGGYSYIPSKNRERIQKGEGLIGQAISSGKILELKTLSPDDIQINYALGQIKPTHVVALPLIDHKIEGAVELASIYGFSELHLEFLKSVGNNIGIAIRSTQNRKRVMELLEETKSQSEELQVQHSELEAINAELEAQTEKLQASEEELRVQQEELEQTNEELSERSVLLEEKNNEIQKKSEALELTTRYKSEFLANMSHELRTPLNSILLLSRLLSENNNQSMNTEEIEFAKVIQSSGNSLLGLIDEILDLSKIEAGKMELEFLDVSTKEITDTLWNLFSFLAKEKGIEFEIISKDAPLVIKTDKMRLEQILKNLISNAIKFTEKGKVSIEIKVNTDDDKIICFIVKDTGIGIPVDKQPLVFEAFQQADGSTKRKYGGTGLGLSISRELAKLLRGEIILHSKVNEGSTFTLCLPVFGSALHKINVEKIPPTDFTEVETETELKTPAKKYISPVIPDEIDDDRDIIKEGDKVILIIEDDINFAKSLLAFTRQKGYKGIVAVRGDYALNFTMLYKPVGVLLDIELPIKSGWEVLEELKNHAETKHIPVHIMSSHKLKQESLLKGAVDFLDKPAAFDKIPDVFLRIEHIINREAQKVLIIEDNPKHAKALSYFLETYNINSEIKSEVADGIQALSKTEVDCVILDMGIPDKQAYQILDGVKKNPGLEKLPVIVFTGKSLSLKEEVKIKKYADSIIVKTAHSYQRMLDEVSLFLHLVEDKKEGKDKKEGHKKLNLLNNILHDKKVLIVDDDVRNIYSLTKALEVFKMSIITAFDGNDAIKVLSENPDTDVVLLDMMMPHMDGYETAEKIRANPKFLNLPVIAVTAKAMTGDREKCIKAGASDYITKPVDVDQLLSLLRVWLYDKV